MVNTSFQKKTTDLQFIIFLDNFPSITYCYLWLNLKDFVVLFSMHNKQYIVF